MSRLLVFALTGFLTMPAVALADSVSLVPSEVDGSSLVLDTLPVDGWQQQRAGNLVSIRFPNLSTMIDTTAFRSPTRATMVKDAHSEIRGSDSYLYLTLGCQCEVTIKEKAGSVLELTIVDIASRTPDIANAVVQAERRNSGPAPWVAPAPVAKPDSIRDTAARPEGVLDVAAARQQLLAQLQRAATAGLIELSDPVDPEPVNDEANSAENSAAASGDTDGPVDEVSADATVVKKHAGERVAKKTETGVITTPAPIEPEETVVVATCFDDEILSFPESFGPADFARQMAEVNASLTAEFDLIDEDSAIDLARLYLSRGIAPEAIMVLENFSQDDARATVLQEIAHVLQGRKLAPGTSLMKEDCRGNHAIWRGYANALSGEMQAALDDELLAGNALGELPFYLRQRIAGQLGLAAADLSDWDTARRFQAFAERAARSGGETLTETLLLSSRLADWHGDEETAFELLHKARETDPEQRDALLLQIAEKILGSERFIGEDTTAIERQLADASQRYRGAPFGEAAAVLEARLFSRRATRQQTLDKLTAAVEAGTLPSESFTPVMTSLIVDPYLAGSSKPLAEIYIEEPEKFDEALSQDGFRHAVIRSMVDLGVPTLAKPLLRDADLKDPDLIEALAGSFLTEAFPEEALDLAKHLPSGLAQNQITAAALLDSGRPELAAPYLSGSTGDATPADGTYNALLSEQFRVALGNGDIALARETLDRLLDVEPTTENAELAILLALESAEENPPQVAREILQNQDPERLAQLEQLFEGASSDLDSAAMGQFLEETRAETQMIKEMLSDG